MSISSAKIRYKSYSRTLEFSIEFCSQSHNWLSRFQYSKIVGVREDERKDIKNKNSVGHWKSNPLPSYHDELFDE